MAALMGSSAWCGTCMSARRRWRLWRTPLLHCPGEWTRGGCNRRGSAKRVDLCKVSVAVAFLKSWSKHTGKNSDCCPHLTQEAQAVVKLLRLTDARAYCCRGVRHSGRAAGDDHLVAAGDPCQAGTPCPIHQPLQQSISVLWQRLALAMSYLVTPFCPELLIISST